MFLKVVLVEVRAYGYGSFMHPSCSLFPQAVAISVRGRVKQTEDFTKTVNFSKITKQRVLVRYGGWREIKKLISRGAFIGT